MNQGDANTFSDYAEYWAIMLDKKLTFRNHIEYEDKRTYMIVIKMLY